MILMMQFTMFKRHDLNAPINVTPHHPQHGVRWGNVGICTCGFYNAPGVGERLACKSPTFPPLGPYWCIVQTEKTMLHVRISMFTEKTNVSNAPPLGQQTAGKSPHNPLPYPVLGEVGRDNDRRIKLHQNTAMS